MASSESSQVSSVNSKLKSATKRSSTNNSVNSSNDSGYRHRSHCSTSSCSSCFSWSSSSSSSISSSSVSSESSDADDYPNRVRKSSGIDEGSNDSDSSSDCIIPLPTKGSTATTKRSSDGGGGGGLDPTKSRRSSGINEGGDDSNDSFSDCMIPLPPKMSRKKSKTRSPKESSDSGGSEGGLDTFRAANLQEPHMSGETGLIKVEKEGPSSPSSPSSPERLPDGEWEIERILDYVKDDFGELYLVKWKDWEDIFNTWEPPINLDNCLEERLRFRNERNLQAQLAYENSEFIELPNGKRRRKGPAIPDVPPDPRTLDERMQEFWQKGNCEPLEKELKRIYRKWIDNQYPPKYRLPKPKLDKLLDKGMAGKLSDEDVRTLRKELMIIIVESKEKTLKIKFKEWEERINKITLGKPRITIENNADLVGPPEDFEFVNEYIPGDGVEIPNDPPMGCSCGKGKSCYDSRNSCCASAFGYNYAYTRLKKVNVPRGRPIYECNSKCQCDQDCPNRVVQNGNTDHMFCVFRTFDNKGWGVKTLKDIKKGSFVVLYAGEVIKSDEANRRGKLYDETGVTYLFDLDFNDQENFPYSVDSFKYGNVSRFINHSCMPNLEVYNVWTDCLDPNLPKIAFFAAKDIEEGEELTFDYDINLAAECRSKTRLDENQPLHKRVECLCGTPKCRKYIFY